MDEAGLNKSAILLMTLGEEEAAEVFKHLGPKEVQKLGSAMAGMKNVSREAVDQVLVDFQTQAGTRSTFGNGGDEYLRSVLNRALGEDKAGYLLDRILQGSDTSSIESLKWMDAPTVA